MTWRKLHDLADLAEIITMLMAIFCGLAIRITYALSDYWWIPMCAAAALTFTSMGFEALAEYADGRDPHRHDRR